MRDSLKKTPNGHCVSCQLPLKGRYCHTCGEKSLEEKDLSLTSSLAEFCISMVELDGKFWKSFKYLVNRPGQLTYDYLVGRRIAVLSPFKILLASKIFYFLMISIFAQSILTTPLKTHVTAYNFLHQPLAKKMVEERIKERGSSFEEEERKFDEMSEKQAKTLTFIMVPLLFVFVSALMYFLGGQGLQNLIFATHFVSYMLIVLALVVPVIHVGVHFLHHYTPFQLKHGYVETIFSSILFLIYWLYFYCAVKRVYALEWKRALITSILLAVSVYWVFILYRMLLFFTTFSVI